MITLVGKWFDGRTSAQVVARCHVYDNGRIACVRASDGAPLSDYRSETVKIAPRVGDTPCRLIFPDGAKLETSDFEAVDALAAHRLTGGAGYAWIHRLERNKRYIALALLLLVVLVWTGLRYGVPWTAKLIADRLPPEIIEMAGRQTQAVLDAGVFEPSALAVETRQRIATRLQTVIDAHPQLKLKVHFRKGGRLGPNALALPDGTIIFTDEMCALAQDDDELVAVMAHEAGHVVHRHGLRMLIQDALLAFGVVALTGELSGSAELLVGLPVLLTELAYSREFEREADRYALSFLRTHNISPRHFAALMRRIEAQQSAKKPAGKNNQWMGYLSTHPLTEKRLEAFDTD